ncbi:MAG: ATP-binding protein, partial [Campylobacterota bacterium]|nr:ATP-binding protein [Campylobacterota bacterium]
KLLSLNRRYFIEEANAEVAVNEQKRLTTELESHTKELKVDIDDKTVALREKIVELEEATKIKSQFLANMSHEIRTPMNAILGFIQILERTESDNSKLRKFTIIKSAANSLLTIINDILDFSKIESGKLELESLHVNTKKPFKEVAKLFYVKANEKKITITYSFDENLPRFFIGDPVRLKQVISNLLNNAIKFTPNGGKIRMRVECDEFQRELTCKIIDNGVGISAKNLEKIFAAFSQEDDSTTRKYGGTGLGLSISQNLITLMGGTISVESENAQGSIFSFTIPLIEDEFVSKA